MKKIQLLAAAAVAFAALWACQSKDEPVKPQEKATVSVSPATVAFEDDGGTLRVAVTTNQDAYTVTGAAEWLKVEQNGKEIVLTAGANTVNETKSCTLTVKAGDASASIAVSQKPGSPYPGYTVVNEVSYEYAGTMLYMFGKPSDPDYGGMGFLTLTDEDGNSLALQFYTPLYKSEEEVELPAATYTKGEDEALAYVGKVFTYIPGSLMSFDDDETSILGSAYTSAATETTVAIVDGTFEVSADNGKYTIKTDLKDSEGKDYKLVYIGSVTVDAEGATYPSDKIDVANELFGAQCYYRGDYYENGTTNFQLNLYSGDPDNLAVTVFEFNTEAVDFTEDMDISGIYTFPSADEGEEEDDEESGDESDGTLVPGALIEFMPGFSFPMGTYVMYPDGDKVIADTYASLVLDKQEDGKYTLTASIMSSTGEMVLFMNKTVEIPVTMEEEDDED